MLPAFAHAKRNSVLHALISHDPQKLAELGERYGAPVRGSYDDYEDCLREVDAVYIALPNSQHAEFTMRAANAGVHVLCEKPLAVTDRECQQMIAACRDANVKLMTAYRLHFEPTTLEVLELARSGRLGDLRYATGAFSMRVTPGDIRTKSELGGGTLYDLGVYCIQAARLLFGSEPFQVQAAAIDGARAGMPGIDEMTTAVLSFDGDRTASFTTSFGAADVSSFRIVGTQGAIHLEPAFEYAEPLAYTLTLDGKTTKKQGQEARSVCRRAAALFGLRAEGSRAGAVGRRRRAGRAHRRGALRSGSAGAGRDPGAVHARPRAQARARHGSAAGPETRARQHRGATRLARNAPARRRRSTSVDLNAVAAGLLRDLASIQTSPHKQRGYGGAAGAVMRLDEPLTALRQADGTIRKIAAIGPSSARIIAEVLETGGSATVEAAVQASGRAADVARRRGLRDQSPQSRSRAGGPQRPDPSVVRRSNDYRGDFQMHSEWSDGGLPLRAFAEACAARGYQHSAVTDHAFGLPLAGGLSTTDLRRQHAEIDQVNHAMSGRFRLLKGVEANIQADGSLDVTHRRTCPELDLVLAAPHSKLREATDQTAGWCVPSTTPASTSSRTRAGASWENAPGSSRTGRRSSKRRRRLARRSKSTAIRRGRISMRWPRRLRYEAGCLFALDSDAHNDRELVYAETAIAHARLAGIPPERIVNCWPLERLLEWANERAPSGR